MKTAFLASVRSGWTALACCGLLATAACQSAEQKAAAASAQAQQLSDAGQNLAAAKVLQKALVDWDEDPELWLQLARIRAAMGDGPGAYAAYRSVLDLDRANREALNNAAQLALSMGAFSDADKYATQILSLDPTDTVAQMVQGFVAVAEQRYGDGGDIATKLITADPSNATAYVIRSMVLERTGDPAAALAALQPVTKAPSPDVLGQLRRLYERVADPRRAVPILIQQTKASPQNNAFRLALAKGLYLLGRTNDAATVLNNLHTRAPSDELRADTVALWYDTGKDVQAIAGSVTALGNANPELRIAAAQYLVSRNQPKLAVAMLQDTPSPATMTPAAVDMEGVRALALVGSGQAAAGAALADAVLKVDATQPYALLARARVELAAGNTDDAMRDARVILRDNAQMAMAYRLLADVYLRQGDTQLADRAMDDGQTAMPNSAEFLSLNVARLMAEKDAASAASILRDFTVQAPSSAFAWALRAKACGMTGDQACVTRSQAILARLGGANVPFPAIPQAELPVDRPETML